MDKPPEQMRLVHFGPFEANLTTGELSKHGIRLKLQDQPFQVLKMLLARPGELVTREEIRQTLWPSGTFVDFDNGLNAAVNRLREALADSAEHPRFIETLPRRGYRFIGAPDTASSANVRPVPSASAAREERKSIAVLYFDNLSADKEDEYFRDGVTEDVITDLSKINGLHVFPRSAVAAYRDRPAPAPHVAQELGVAYVLQGSVRKSGHRLRLTANLVEARSGHSLWAERYDRQMEDIFAIQDEIAQNIAAALRVMLSDGEKKVLAKTPTKDVQAYDYYLRGMQFFHQSRKKAFDYARQMFARAIALDPGYARAHAGVADCCSQLYMWWEPSEANLKEADAASLRALTLDPESPEAHASRGLALSLNKRYEEAAREFEIAIRLNPRLFEAHYFYARTRFAEGKLEQAATLFEQSSEVNPNDYQSLTLQAMCLSGLGREREAIDAARKGLSRVEKILQFHPDDARALYMAGFMLARLGDRPRALEYAERALAIDPEDGGILYNVACLFAMVGKKERALKTLEDAVRHGLGHKEWIEHDPDLNSLRGEPRFQALLAKL